MSKKPLRLERAPSLFVPCSHALSVLLALKAKMELPTRLSPKAEKVVRERLAKEGKK